MNRTIQLWKLPNLIKGVLTWVPPLNAVLMSRAATGGTVSTRYCYGVWLRHLRTLEPYGFRVSGAYVGELGPGDSIGIGLAALLSGARSYIGFDIVPFSAKADLVKIFDELVQLYSTREPVPDEREFPFVRPRLTSYDFPNDLVDTTHNDEKAKIIRRELRTDLSNGGLVNYRAPWTSLGDVLPETLDLIFSQAVLEHVNDLPETYHAMFAWLKPGGYASQVIDFGAHHLSPFWENDLNSFSTK